MQATLPRLLESDLRRALRESPAVALLGPRQCGKTTLALDLVATDPQAIYLDLERPADQRRLTDPDLYFRAQREQGIRLFCLDEIQLQPEIFTILRSLIDDRRENGQFLFLGSASRELIRQTSESLAGRIQFLELAPLTTAEVGADRLPTLMDIWTRGGFPRSFLAEDDAASYRWRQSFIRSFLERDIPQLGFDIPAASLYRLWRLLAHHHGQMLNASKLGAALGVTHTTIRSWLDLLSQTFMIRLLEPTETNLGKRLVKSPKVYIRDSGILHALLEIESNDALFGHTALGPSWEGLVIENLLAMARLWRPSFFRTSNGAEVDLILERGTRRLAVECKASSAPDVSRGFWQSIEDLGVEHAYIVAPVEEAYPIRKNVEVCPLNVLVERLRADP